MNKNKHANEFDLRADVPEMPEHFLRRVEVTCETLPEKERRVPRRKVSLAVALCMIAVLAVFFTIGRPGGAPDMLTPLTQAASEGETDLLGEDALTLSTERALRLHNLTNGVSLAKDNELGTVTFICSLIIEHKRNCVCNIRRSRNGVIVKCCA